METIDGKPIEIAVDNVDCDLKLIQQTGNEIQESKSNARLETTYSYIPMDQIYKIRQLSLTTSEFLVLLLLMAHDLPDRRNRGRRKGWVMVKRARIAKFIRVSEFRYISQILCSLEKK